ncbi:claspin-like [Daktulosphaira vitifoliae]|uniref:claspin-like n=1 Tax=Daktulosphaira vitifoliae TaxID=58002 RepID=UPI0021A98F19|nr:claspin-like [Daktulosphaira vitifoliae]
MNSVFDRKQIPYTKTIVVFLLANLIVSIDSITVSTDNTFDSQLKNTFDTIKSSIDSRVSGNGQFGSFIYPDNKKKSYPEFPRLHEDIHDQMKGWDFNFNHDEFKNIKIPQEQSFRPKKLLNFEPLRPFNYFSSQNSHKNRNSNLLIPGHQDDGSDEGNSSGNEGGSGGDNGGDSGNDDGGDGGGSGGNLQEDEDDETYAQKESVELDYESVKNQNDGDWNTINPDKSRKQKPRQFRDRPQLKRIAGYGAHKLLLAESDKYNKNPHSQRTNKQKYIFDSPYSANIEKRRRPMNAYEERPKSMNEKKKQRHYRIHDDSNEIYNNIVGRSNKPALSKRPSKLSDYDEEDEPKTLQSKRQHTKKKQVCHKIRKSMTPDDIEDHDSIGRQMTCMRCKDIATGGSFEKCAYKSQPESGEYYRGTEVIRGTPYKAKQIRYKRKIIDKKPESEESTEKDYEYENQAEESEEEPEYTAESAVKNDNENDEETAENESGEYDLPMMPIKSATCSKIRKEGNICNVCRDNLTNRKYEECEYESDPKNNAYEYSTRNQYGTPRYRRQLDSDQTYDDYFKKLFPVLGSNRKSSLATKFSSKDGDFGFLDNGHIGFKKTKSKFIGDKNLSINFDSGEESEVNKMLGEFRNKDRSNCKKSLKDKMTCYKCKDDKGLETEECMYITDESPKQHKQSYHETKKFSNNPLLEEAKSNQNVSQQLASSSLSTAYAPLHLYNSGYEPKIAYSYNQPYTQETNYRLRKKPVDDYVEALTEEYDDDQSEAQSSSSEDYEEDPSSKKVSRHDLPDVDPFGPEGAYSEETVPVYDTQLGTWLPRYMVQRSEEEAIVDAELGFD